MRTIGRMRAARASGSDQKGFFDPLRLLIAAPRPLRPLIATRSRCGRYGLAARPGVQLIG